MKVVSTVFITTISLVAIHHTAMTLAFIYLCVALNTVSMAEELVCLSCNYLHLSRSL